MLLVTLLVTLEEPLFEVKPVPLAIPETLNSVENDGLTVPDCVVEADVDGDDDID